MQEAWTAEKQVLYEQVRAQAEQLQASQEEAKALLARFERESSALTELQKQYNAVRPLHMMLSTCLAHCSSLML